MLRFLFPAAFLLLLASPVPSLRMLNLNNCWQPMPKGPLTMP